MERDGSVLGSLFNQIIADMKNTSPLWEDFVVKASKLHACLRAAIQAIAAYLDAFQKIADAATNSRGATKEIGTALTRVCLRHKAVETRLKTFTSAIMDCLVLPLQDKLEDWKRSVATIDKEHAKEHKRCRTELKKRSSDTLRLQKKARKGQTDNIQSLVDSHMQDVTQRRAELEEVERKSLRSAMVEERVRYCTFVHLLQPVVREECEVMFELGHLQEAMQSIAMVTKEPHVLPQASEELILDAKSSMSLYPESPGGGSGSQGGCSNSLGSRKSSVCSISSMNSSGSSGSPGHHHYQRSLSQFVSPAIRLKPGESSDSGFSSSPALTTQVSNTTNQSHAVSTWPPHSQDVVCAPPAVDRPHTISTAYEKGHQRPPLTVYTFQNPETIMEGSGANGASTGSLSGQTTPSSSSAQKSPGAGACATLSRPPLPVRCSSLERPLSANNNNRNGNALLQRQCPSPIPAHITKELSSHHAQQQQLQQQQQLPPLQSPPTYVNMSELANMAAMKISNQQQLQLQQQQQQQPPATAQLQQQQSIDSLSSQQSNDSTQQQQNVCNISATTQHHSHQQQHQQHSQSTNSSSSNASLHSHPSIDSTVATPLIGQTPTPSSGCSTPQNHYSPLLTNSPSSAGGCGTPSGASIASGPLGGSSGGGGGATGFVYNINSPTPPLSLSSLTSAAAPAELLQIIETDNSNNANNTDDNHTTTNNMNIDIVAAIDSSTDLNASSSSSANVTDSPTIVENDERSRASVLQKASMFEKQAAAVSNSTPLPPAGVVLGRNSNMGNSNAIAMEAIYGTRRGEEYRSSTPLQQQQIYAAPDKDVVDKSFEDSIQELNNLIGELDSFQREIDESKQQQLQQQQQHVDVAIANTSSTTATLTEAACTLLNYQQQQQEVVHQQLEGVHQPQEGVHQPQQHVHQQQQLVHRQPHEQEHLEHVHTQQQHVHSSQQHEPTPLTSLPYCGSSNQTNSSGCGTDISDTTSDELAACTADKISIASHGYGNSSSHSSNNNKHYNYNSDSEQSRCYMSETSSLIGGGGYENPTFAHLAASKSSLCIVGGIDAETSSIGDSRSLLTGEDGMSQTSETLSTQRHIYSDMLGADVGGGDDDGCGSGRSSSAVVVIYDHQIPMTPDMDYASQNSEIVVLRTKQTQQQLPAQQMRELQQLPPHLCGTPVGILTPTAAATATVAPAKQRLSSFRASSEQQLQLLGSSSSNHYHHQQQQHLKGTNRLTTTSKKTLKLPATPTIPATTTVAADATSATTTADNILRRKLLPPKPSLSIFTGNNGNIEVNNNSSNNSSNNNNTLQQQLQPAKKADFKADLDAKIRKQKQKLLLQEQQQQQSQSSPNQQQQQQAQPQSSPAPPVITNNNCNAHKYRSALPLPPTLPPSSSSKSLSTASATSFASPSSISLTNGSNYNVSSSSSSLNALTPPPPPLPPTIKTTPTTHQPSQQHLYCNGNRSIQQQHHQSTHYQQQHQLPNHFIHSPTSSKPSATLACSSNIPTTTATTTTTSIPSPLLPASKMLSSTPSPTPSAPLCLSPSPLSSLSSSSSSATTNTTTATSLSSSAASAAKPNISPRPASLSGGTTRIARRSSVNTAKPPPPVRRSSSVTPSPNVSTAQQSHASTPVASPASTTSSTNAINSPHHPQQYNHNHNNLMINSIDNLPPPPAFLLEQRQTSTPTSPQPPQPPTPTNIMPQSSQKVAETVKALSALRLQPPSPSILRRAQVAGGNQQQQRSTTITTLQSPLNTYHPTTTTNNMLHDEPDYDAFYNPYAEVKPPASHTSSATASVSYLAATPTSHISASSTPAATPTSCHKLPPLYYQPPSQHQPTIYAAGNAYNLPSPPPPLATALMHDHSSGPPPLPPPNPNHHHQHNNHNKHQHYQQRQNHQQHQQQQHLQQQQQQQLQSYNKNACDSSNNIYDNQSSFRTSSPGIYAQPKIVSNMSSFRSASPGGAGAQAANGYQIQQPQAQLPPAQPKTNPNLISQLNARLSKQPQNAADQAIYGSTPIAATQQHHQQQQQLQHQQQQHNEAIYMRNYGQQQQHHQQQQQHNYDA